MGPSELSIDNHLQLALHTSSRDEALVDSHCIRKLEQSTNKRLQSSISYCLKHDLEVIYEGFL